MEEKRTQQPENSQQARGEMIISSQRYLFDIPEDIAYFNCAYNSPQLKESTRRLIVGVHSKAFPWERTAASFFEDAETVRNLASNLFGGDRDGYAIVPAASYGLSTAARAIEPHLKTGDSILVIAEEFPSNVLPWKRVAKEVGAAVLTVPTPENGDWTQAILNRINRAIKVVAISTCHWTNGAYIDLRPIGAACRDAGSILVVDATQSLGAMPFPMAEVNPDFLVAAGYKWLLSPYGFGLLYVSEGWREGRPLEETWLARENAEDFARLVKYSDRYMPGARKFDVGEKCTPTILPGAIAALQQITAWGIDNLTESLCRMNSQIAAALSRLGFQLQDETQRCPHLFGAQSPKGDAKNFVAELKKQKIYISQRGNSLRVAPHLHVTDNDIGRFIESLQKLM